MTRFHVLSNLKTGWQQDRPWSWLIVIAALLNFTDWLVMWRLSFVERTLAPLHYTIYFGTDLSVNPRLLLIIPSLGLLVVLTHFFSSGTFRDPLWRRTWGILAIVFNVLLLAVSATLYYVATTFV